MFEFAVLAAIAAGIAGLVKGGSSDPSGSNPSGSSNQSSTHLSSSGGSWGGGAGSFAPDNRSYWERNRDYHNEASLSALDFAELEERVSRWGNATDADRERYEAQKYKTHW